MDLLEGLNVNKTGNRRRLGRRMRSRFKDGIRQKTSGFFSGNKSVEHDNANSETGNVISEAYPDSWPEAEEIVDK